MSCLSAILLLFSACAPGDDAASDREHYLASMDGPFAEAIARCGRIREPALRGACRVQRVREEVLADPEAGVELCRVLQEGAWRDECVFLVSDTVVPPLDEALHLCGQAGRFESECRDHAFGRAMYRTVELYEPVGREKALELALTELARRHRPTDDEAHRRAVARYQVAGAIARRFGETFDPERCGVADEALCARAWEMAQQGEAIPIMLPPVETREEP